MRIVYVLYLFFVLFYLAAFFGEAFFPAFGLAEVFFVAGFLVAVDFGFFAAAAFFGFEALLATFFAGVAAAVAGAAAAVPVAAALLADDVDVVLFLAFVVVAFVFGFTCRGFLVAFAPFELDRGFAAFVDLAFFGLTADDVALPLLATVAVVVELPLVAGFLTVFGPGDFDALRFLVGDDEPVLELDVLFLVFVDDFLTFFTAVESPSLNEPLAPLPFVCLKCLDLTPFFNATFKC